MGRKAKYTKEQKIKVCKDYLSGRKTANQIAYELNPLAKNLEIIIFKWIRKYKIYGSSAFDIKTNNGKYSHSFKVKVVKEYLLNNDGLEEICNKYNIPSHETLRSWVMKYNKGEELKDYYPEHEVYSMKSRPVTKEEKQEIINYVLENDNDYKGAASKYNVPYHQVFNWVRKYKEVGDLSFNDRRGRPSSKSIKELTEVEKLQIELEKQKRINERLELANEILKKNLEIRMQLEKDSRK